MPRLLTLIVLPLSVSAWVISPQYAERCFERQENKAISTEKPMAEVYQATVFDCFNYCVYSAYKTGNECGSIVYHKREATCQAYPIVRNRRAYYKEETVVEADSHDFYHRTSFDGHCSAPRDRPVARARAANTYTWANDKATAPIPLNTVNLSKLAEKEASFMEAIFRSDKGEENEYEYDDEKNLEKNAEKTAATSAEKLDKQGEDAATVISQSDLDEIYSKRFQNAFREGVLFPNPSDGSECTNDARTSFFVLFGYSILSPSAPRNVLKGADQNTCFRECSHPKANNDQSCVSANYDLSNGECSLFSASAKVEQKRAVIMENDNIMFADKFCLESQRKCSTDTPFIVYPFKQIHKKIFDWQGQVFSPVNCIAKCIDTPNCKAATYKSGLCIMHSESPIGDPSILIEGSTETLVIENGCSPLTDTPTLLSDTEQAGLGGEDQPGEWEEWSGCVFGGSKYAPSGKGGRVRVRHRECPDGIPCDDLEVQNC